MNRIRIAAWVTGSVALCLTACGQTEAPVESMSGEDLSTGRQALTLALGPDYSQCTPNSCGALTAADNDQDSLPDSLEAALAWRFFPDIRAQWTVDAQVWYGSQGKPVPYTAHKLYQGSCAYNWACIEIRYGIAFDADCGDNYFGGVSCDGIQNHPGDSEFYAVVVKSQTNTFTTDASQWVMIRDFTSAHWGEGSVDSSAMAYYSGHNPSVSGRMLIYASEGKHALYHSVSACNSGGWYHQDDCPYNDKPLSLTQGLLQNVGEYGYTTNIDSTIDYPNNSGTSTYDVWSTDLFGSASNYRSKFQYPFSWNIGGTCNLIDEQNCPGYTCNSSCATWNGYDACSCTVGGVIKCNVAPGGQSCTY